MDVRQGRPPLRGGNCGKTPWLFVLLALVISCETATVAADDAPPPAPIELREFLILPRVGRYGRSPIHVDPIQAAMAGGTWKRPTAGSTMQGTEALAATWQAQQVDPDGWLKHSSLRGGYAYAEVPSPRDQVWLLEAAGHAMVYVNSEPRAGDPYQTGRTVVPVRLHKGVNEFLFHVANGRLRARLAAPAHDVSLDLRDNTLPDLVAGEQGRRWIGVLVVNARNEPFAAGQLTATHTGAESVTTALGPIPACSVRKAAVQIDGTLPEDAARSKSVRVQLNLEETSPEGSPRLISSAALDLAVVGAHDLQTRTFVSRVDLSVQSYALLPASALGKQHDGNTPKKSPGLLVALHGTGVGAKKYLARQQAKTWAHILAPEGRRPYGFDWEDWSARDVLEAMDDAAQRIPCDARRVWLTGRTTGGHGVWHLGAAFPDRFAALGVDSGWISYKSYGRSLPTWKNPSPVQQMLLRGAGAVDTLALAENLTHCGIYLRHDLGDPTVPVDEARQMRRRLADFHGDFIYQEVRPSDASREAACCDGSAMARFFRHRTAPAAADVDEIDFSTFDPGQSAGNRWLTIAQQQHSLQLSRAVVRLDRSQRRLVGTTVNVAALAIDLSHLAPGPLMDVILDGEVLGPMAWPGSGSKQLWLVRDDEGWHASRPLAARMKQPSRYGNFKSVLDNRVVFVYGTRGNEAENRWAFAKARFDAEMFLVRANGSVEVVEDVAFQPEQYADRNVVLYGNADTNAAWPKLLSTSPVQIRRGSVRVGMRPETDDHLGCVFVRPRPGSATALIGAVSGTGVVGLRATDRLPYFVSGVVLPDLLLFGSETLQMGTDDVRAVGCFGLDWSLDGSEIVWRDAAL